MFPAATEARAGVWMNVLDPIQDKLAATLALATERNLPVFPPVPEPGMTARLPLGQLDERLGGLQTCLDKAAAKAAPLDASLQQEVEQVRHFLDQLHEVERKLADWVNRAV